MAQIILENNVSSPSAPAAGKITIFSKSDGSLWKKEPNGSETPIDTIAQFSADNPEMNDVADPGVEDSVSRGDHIHPSDTSKADLSGAAFTGPISAILPFSLGSAFAINTLGQIGLNGAGLGESDFNWTGGTYATVSGHKSSMWINRTIQSDVTNSYTGYRSRLTTAAAAFTVPLARHFFCDNSTLGAGSAITDLRGFEAVLANVAANNYGFYGNVATAGNSFNFFAASTAQNQFNGETWVGRTIPGNGPSLNIGPDYTGTYGPTTVPRLKVNSTTSGATIGVGRWGASATGSTFAGFKSRGATVGVEGAVQLNDNLVALTGAGSDGVTGSGVRGQYTVRAAENWAAGAHGTFAEVNTTPIGATSMQSVMTWGADRRSYAAGDLSCAGTLLTTQIPSSTLTANSTLSAAAIRNGIIVASPAAAINLTLPTGTLLESDFPGSIPNNQSFEWSVINLAAATHAITVLAGTTHTAVGNMVVAANTSARFMTRKTTTNTFITYRIA